MPSPCSPKGGFYLRKGGAWKQTKNGQMKYVGYGKGPPAPLPGGGYFRTAPAALSKNVYRRKRGGQYVFAHGGLSENIRVIFGHLPPTRV